MKTIFAVGEKGEKMDKLVKAIIVLFIVGILCFGVYVLVTYGGKPITEIPAWAVPFFLGK